MKKVFSFLLVLVVSCTLVSCTGKENRPAALSADEVAQVTASTAIYSSYLYVIEDRAAVAELTELYNGLTYRELRPGEEAPDGLLSEMYILEYYDAKGEVITDCFISPEGYVRFRDSFETVYVLTSDFDEENLMNILEKNNIFQ